MGARAREFSDDGVSPSLSEALVFATMCIIGLPVEVHVKDGSVYSGILHTACLGKDYGAFSDPISDLLNWFEFCLGIILKKARMIKKGKLEANVAHGGMVETLVILTGDLVQVVAKAFQLSDDDIVRNITGEDTEAVASTIPSFECLGTEAKMLKPSNAAVHKKQINNTSYVSPVFLDWGTVDSRGSAGGIVVLWDSRVLEMIELEKGECSISCDFKNCEDGFTWTFTGVYGPTKRRERENLWNELGAIHGLWNGPWCVAGDFNAILSPEERSRGGSFNSDMRRFAEVIEELQLKDLTLFGGPFTWSGGVNNQTMSRLDRFLVNEGWDCRFSHSRQSVLPRPVSDHFPILLEGGGLRNGPSPFRFENMWLKVVKIKLKEWNRDVFGKVEYRKNVALDQMQFWDAKEKINRLTLEEMEARREAREEYKKWVLLEEVTWRQKSREVWLKEGDRNTSFFHRMANAHRRRNNMERIRINGMWKLEENGMSEGIVNAFKTLLSNPGDWRPSLAGLQCEQLQSLDADALEVPFTEEEVHDALVGCSGDKALGPDGFTMSFWQFAWDFVKEDVMRFFREFHEHGKFVKRLNTIFLVLIPKKMGAEDLREFRPINLVGSLYKWLAKVLANRLKRAVGKVVSKAQGAFVEGRQILDAVLIANEAIDSILKNNENGILCKLDIEKAYDNVDWSFLLTVMQKMGFGEKWLGWIKWCISTASFSVLINGTPKGFFQSSRGLRQGDPLSPYLFVIAMEVFSSFLNRAVDNGYISGCQVKGRNEGGVQISHLLFADDTLVFCQASQDQLTYLSWLLMWFEAASGMRINLDKSELIPVGRVVDIDDLALDFGCKVGSLPSTYLGLPLGAPFKSVAMWDGVEERFRKRLTMWKRQYLSKGGRATLIRSTLSNLPIYYMSVLSLPSSVRRRLEQIQRDFLWGGGSLERKPHLVRWKVVCLSKKKGGLGIKCLSNLNKALLSKWNWRFANEREALWNQVIRGNVGNGRRVSFWRDRWCGDAPLCDSFPSIYALSIEKEAWVADVWDPLVQGGRGGWNPCFSRALNDWEVEEAELFLGCLHGKRVIGDVDDKVVWTETKSGIFSAKSLYLALEADCPSSFPSSCIWKVWVQPKISFFTWEAAWGKALTLDLVQRRVRKTLLSWQTSSMGKKHRKVWKAAPLHIFWTVWKARNRLAFKDDDISIQWNSVQNENGFAHGFMATPSEDNLMSKIVEHEVRRKEPSYLGSALEIENGKRDSKILAKSEEAPSFPDNGRQVGDDRIQGKQDHSKQKYEFHRKETAHEIQGSSSSCEFNIHYALCCV
ncbi:Transposon TX1 uncharacterized 149 kDa protein [Vitis vinifera]|uniref:Transposon TX1 uncharacterized 149 kDa protein n=1 Tax=Vitis vinifera TaxID=29760 RepID=A0A438DXI4_VITVI|nr:Transposon TX1 uncharacterized 149 kDa protein [Vitis vinifera]